MNLSPTEVTAQAGNDSATVPWQPSESDGGAPITGYVITPHDDGTALEPITVDEDATEVVVSDLTAGEPYTFTVTAENMTGPGPASQPINVTHPH